ncbi:MAG TPA: hypothetical protein VFF11_07225, partial [Candidatus Binatia bacterium]|nr:hypothetical protein [Candidatus Binatia bacterium]
PQILQSLGLYGAEYNRKANAYASAHPGTGYSGDGGYGVIVSIFNPPPPIIPSPRRYSLP